MIVRTHIASVDSNNSGCEQIWFCKPLAEKINKYCSLAADFHHMYNMPVTIVPVILGCTGVVSSRCLQYLRKIPGFTLKLFSHLQKAVLIGTSQVLRTIPIHQ